MKKICLITILLTIIILLSGCEKKDNALLSDRSLLTKVVYNSIVANNEDYKNQKIKKNEELSHSFSYSSFNIINSFSFILTFNFDIDPCLENYIKGEEVNTFIVLLKFFENNDDSYIYQKMIILSYKEQLVGFLSPICGSSISVLNEATNNDESNILYKYSFGSYFFLTNNQIVKYYEAGEKVYDFIYIEDKKGKITLDIDCNGNKFNCIAKKDSKKDLTKDCAFSLINLSIIEKIKIDVQIVSLKDISSKIIYVSSNDYDSLKIVKFIFALIDKNGKQISDQELKEGDIIEVYFYQRYEEYKPVNIIVENIYLK